MKRLTGHTDIGDSLLDEIAFINPDDAEGLYNLREIAQHGSDELLYEIANRLAEYEDLEEQGLLLRLPCKLGIPVYCLMRDGVYSETVEKICVSDMGFYLETENMGFDESDFGKTVFLAREEAEKALED